MRRRCGLAGGGGRAGDRGSPMGALVPIAAPALDHPSGAGSRSLAGRPWQQRARVARATRRERRPGLLRHERRPAVADHLVHGAGCVGAGGCRARRAGAPRASVAGRRARGSGRGRAGRAGGTRSAEDAAVRRRGVSTHRAPPALSRAGGRGRSVHGSHRPLAISGRDPRRGKRRVRLSELRRFTQQATGADVRRRTRPDVDAQDPRSPRAPQGPGHLLRGRPSSRQGPGNDAPDRQRGTPSGQSYLHASRGLAERRDPGQHRDGAHRSHDQSGLGAGDAVVPQSVRQQRDRLRTGEPHVDLRGAKARPSDGRLRPRQQRLAIQEGPDARPARSQGWARSRRAAARRRRRPRADVHLP